MLHLNFTSIIPNRLTDKLKEFKIPSVDRAFTSIIPHNLTDKLKGFKMPSMDRASFIAHNLTDKLTDKLKGFKMPAFDRERIKKFFYEAYLDVHEDDSLEVLKTKVKARKAGQKK